MGILGNFLFHHLVTLVGTWQKSQDWAFLCFLKVGHSRPLYIYFRLFNIVDNKQVNKQMFNINFADGWSWTTGLLYRKQPFYQLSHNHFLRDLFEPSCLWPTVKSRSNIKGKKTKIMHRAVATSVTRWGNFWNFLMTKYLTKVTYLLSNV